MAGRSEDTKSGVQQRVTVREVTPADFSAWLSLWDGYNAFYGRSGPTALAEEVTRTTWSRFLGGTEPLHALVATLDERVVGLAHVVVHRSTTSVAPVHYLQDLYVAADCRGAGVGRTLIEAVYARAQRAGASRVYWQTHETNAVARRLYDALANRSGFIVYRRDLPG